MMAKVVNETTVPEDDELPYSSGGISHVSLALVIAWCGEEPWRVGETLLVPPGAPGPRIWFGRGPSTSGQPCKVPFGQLRLGRWLPLPPIAAQAISRYQLSLHAIDDERMFVHNEGRCPLFLNESPVVTCEVLAGDLLRLGKQLLLICVRRTVSPPGGGGGFPSFPFGGPDPYGMVGESEAIWEVRRQIAIVAGLPGHVLIAGPSGSGKELVARAIHLLSPRSPHRMVARNAATLPESLIDAELFGNAKNYPNSGMPERPGLIGEANGSTLFLDELAELSQSAQSHLLRVLDAGEYHRLGETRARMSDFRLMAATNRDPNSLKHDLLARLTLHITVPGLDARKEDVPLLVRHLCQSGAPASEPLPSRSTRPTGQPAIPLGLMLRLLEHRYETNLRELRSLLWRAILHPHTSEQKTTEPQQPAARTASIVPPSIPGSPSARGESNRLPSRPSAGEHRTLTRPSAQQVQRCLDENNGALEATWRALGLTNRFALLRLIRRYDIEVRRRPARRSASKTPRRG